MIPVIAMLGLVFFTWIVAMYATNRSEPSQAIHVMPEDREKAANAQKHWKAAVFI